MPALMCGLMAWPGQAETRDSLKPIAVELRYERAERRYRPASGYLLTSYPGASAQIPAKADGTLSVMRGGSLALDADGALAVVDRAGWRAYRLAVPQVLDSRGQRRTGVWSLSGGRGGRYRLTMGFDPSGLVYPLLVD